MKITIEFDQVVTRRFSTEIEINDDTAPKERERIALLKLNERFRWSGVDSCTEVRGTNGSMYPEIAYQGMAIIPESNL